MLQPLTSKLILIIDDDGDEEMAFQEIADNIAPSIRCLGILNGFDALEQLKTIIPDLIFLDVSMPRMDGWQCLTAIKENELIKHIPIVIYTTSTNKHDKKLAQQLGADYFLTKPFDYQYFQKTIAEIMLSLIKNEIKFPLEKLC